MGCYVPLWGLLWLSLDPNVFLWVPMGFNVVPMCLYGVSYGSQQSLYVSLRISLSPTVIHGVPMCPNVTLWVPVSPYGSLCVPMCPNVPPMGCYVPLWGLYGVSMWSHGYLWAQMSSYGYLCVSMQSLCASMGSLMGLSEVPMCLYGSHCPPL